LGFHYHMKKFLRGPLNIKLLIIMQGIASFPSAPTSTELRQAEELGQKVRQATQKLNEFISLDLNEFNKLLEFNKLNAGKKPTTN